MTNEIIKEVISGNGNNFSIKELMRAHIQDDKEFKNYITEQVDKIHDKTHDNAINITENKAGVKGLGKALKYYIGPILFLVLGWLAKIQIIRP